MAGCAIKPPKHTPQTKPIYWFPDFEDAKRFMDANNKEQTRFTYEITLHEEGFLIIRNPR